MKTRTRLTLCLGILLLSGCQCSRLTPAYASVVDWYADTKLALDPLYVPGLDISRTGMSDWRCFGLNDRLCPCAGKRCCCCKPIYYPAEYRMKYWAQQGEQESVPTDVMEPTLADPTVVPAPEPAPMPEIVE